ncbi:MAG: hypothetical protein WC551_11655 [Patescibacteria group bacterium]
MSFKARVRKMWGDVREWYSEALENVFYWLDDAGIILVVGVILGLLAALAISDAFKRREANIAVVTAIRADSTYDLGSVVATDQNGQTVIVLDIPVMYIPYLQVGDSLHYNSSYPNPQFVEFRGCITEFSISPDGERVP